MTKFDNNIRIMAKTEENSRNHYSLIMNLSIYCPLEKWEHHDYLSFLFAFAPHYFLFYSNRFLSRKIFNIIPVGFHQVMDFCCNVFLSKPITLKVYTYFREISDKVTQQIISINGKRHSLNWFEWMDLRLMKPTGRLFDIGLYNALLNKTLLRLWLRWLNYFK